MSARKTQKGLSTKLFLLGVAAALLLPQVLVAQGGLILSNGLNPTSLYRVDLVGPGVNEGRFLFDFVHAGIVHAIAICPGEKRLFAIGADRGVRPAVSIVDDLSATVPTELLVGLLPLEFENSVFQLACSPDREFFFTNLKNEVLYTIDPDLDCVETSPGFFECTPVPIGPLRTADGTLVDTHGADIAFNDAGDLYLVTNNINPSAMIRDFYQVDPSTAIATLIREDVTAHNNTGLGFTIDGRLVSSNVDDNLYQIDPATGDATSLGPITVLNVPPGPFVLNINGGDLAGRAPGGTIVVEKQTDPDGSIQSFEFAPSWKSSFSLADGEQNISVDLLPTADGGGPYSIEEIVPDGWQLTSAVCDDGSPPTDIDLADGETVTCVFTNTLETGTIVVQKMTVPSGASQTFEFAPSWKSNFFLADGQQNVSGDLLPSSAGGGPYAVSEINIPSGWELTSAICDDGSNPGSIDLDPGETVICTFVNTVAPGTIVVEKQTDPDGSTQTFEFAPSWKANFLLADGQQNVSGDLVPTSVGGGPYSVSEIVPDGWLLTSALCSDGSNPSAIGLDPGETVTCIFLNTAEVDECPPSIDFETDAAGVPLLTGEIIGDGNQPWAVEGILVSTNDPMNHPLMIFDTSLPTGGDIDLGTPNELFTIPPDFVLPGPGIGRGGRSNQLPRGKALIISQDGDPSDPDDSRGGGVIRLDFDPPVEITEVRVLDIEEAGGTVTAYDDGGGVMLMRPILPLGDNSFQVVQLLRQNVSALEIDFVSSGALTAVIFCEDICVLTPEPPARKK